MSPVNNHSERINEQPVPCFSSENKSNKTCWQVSWLVRLIRGLPAPRNSGNEDWINFDGLTVAGTASGSTEFPIKPCLL